VGGDLSLDWAIRTSAQANLSLRWLVEQLFNKEAGPLYQFVVLDMIYRLIVVDSTSQFVVVDADEESVVVDDSSMVVLDER
jgi:hypothetical protein